jgi:glycosyltransferase involved in cell wall biosynthesis
MTYNLYTPPILFGFLAARLTGSKLVPVLFDMGMPPGDLGRLRMTIYRCVEWIARKMVPRFDGRIVITDRIAEDYAKGRHALVVDGGITESVSSRLFPLSRAAGGEMEKFRMLCAGTLWPGNGVELLLEAMTLIPDQDIELWFAGPDGSSLDAIKRRQKADKRIVYKGLLDHAALFKLYEDADLLLNVRITRSMNTDYLFPSKMLEYLAVGKPVLSTAVAHVEKDYGDYCYVVIEETAAALAAKNRFGQVVNRFRNATGGCRAREFMLKNRTWNAQGKRICAYLEGPCLDR